MSATLQPVLFSQIQHSSGIDCIITEFSFLKKKIEMALSTAVVFSFELNKNFRLNKGRRTVYLSIEQHILLVC